MGQNKIEIKLIAKLARRAQTFKKRIKGLFNKAYELSVLTKSKVAVVIVKEDGKLETYPSSNLTPILHYYLENRKPSTSLPSPLPPPLTPPQIQQKYVISHSSINLDLIFPDDDYHQKVQGPAPSISSHLLYPLIENSQIDTQNTDFVEENVEDENTSSVFTIMFEPYSLDLDSVSDYPI